MNAYLEKPCDRCGSKKRVAKKWKETVPTMTGTVVVQYTQIVCTKKECQIAFEKVLLEETKKRQALKVKKDANDVARKASLLKIKKKKNKSRI